MESMFDANEEQLLTDLLHEIGKADRSIQPPSGLESRMMARWDARALRPNSPRNYWRIGAFAAAAAGIIAGLTLSERARPAPADDQPSPVVSRPIATTKEIETANGAGIVRSERRTRPAAVQTVRRAPAQPTDVLDFIPLAPMTPDALSRSLQIVPIRIGDTPADLLLGEDGTAKAIRVSSSPDAHVFWRPRR
jgi:hypothetical protein